MAAGAGLALLAAVVAVFSAPGDLLPGSPRADLGQQFLAWRAFAADSLRHGHLPLWNPFVYAGEPFLAGFQSAVLYPLNVVFLVLPLVRAVNLSLILHAFILGAGLYRWARMRGLHPLAGATGAAILVFGGPVFPQVYAGHLSNLCALAWAPWIFASVEDWLVRRTPRALAIAAAATALQILAGQMQYVFYTSVAVVLQFVVLTWPSRWSATSGRAGPDREQHLRSLWQHPLFVLLLYCAAAALAAIQLLPGWQTAQEGLRQGPLPAEFAGQFSLPPENLLTTIAGGFFGDPVHHLYWGRCYPWEMSLFAGAAAVLLGAIAFTKPTHRRRAAAGLMIASPLLLLALGRHTPLFNPLLHYAPGFGRFRGWSKFTFPAFVFLTLIVAEGADVVIRLPHPASSEASGRKTEHESLEGFRYPRRTIPLFGIGLGAILAAAGGWLALHTALLAPSMARIYATGESYLPAATFTDPAVIHAAGVQAGRSLMLAGIVALVAGLSLALSRLNRLRPLRWMVFVLVGLELAGFARSQWATFRQSEAVLPELRAFISSHPGDYRVQNLIEPNNGFLLGAADIWGNDPALLKRYAELIAFSQGIKPDLASQNVDFHSVSPFFPLLRLSYIFTQNAAGVHEYPVPGAMDRVQLISRYRVVSGRDAAFAAMSQSTFDPRSTVILEQALKPSFNSSLVERVVPFSPSLHRTSPDAPARVISSSADAFTVEANTSSPTLLLVADAFSRDWHATALPGSAQQDYTVMPADYAFRATPLAAGHHLIRFEYRPRGLALGAAISILAWAAWLALWLWRKRL